MVKVPMLPAHKRVMDQLDGAIRRFYENLTDRRLLAAHAMLDNEGLDNGHISASNFLKIADQFCDVYHCAIVLDTEMSVSLGEKNEIYNGRDYAIGKTYWQDGHGVQRYFRELWVKCGREWKSRNFTLAHFG